jgi:hypothetical protein
VQAEERLVRCREALLAGADPGLCGPLEGVDAQLDVAARALAHVQRLAAEADAPAKPAKPARAAPKKPAGKKSGASEAPPARRLQLDAATLCAPLHSDAWAPVRNAFRPPPGPPPPPHNVTAPSSPGAASPVLRQRQG